MITKKCSECNVEMIEKYGIRPGEYAEGFTKKFIYITTSDHYGKKVSRKSVKCRICPNCGKIEMFIDPEDLKV